MLLANLTAHDFGYITAGSLIERTAATFRTMARLSRYRGHFYNWYDTQTLQPLPPRYVSSVDSGNLAGYLLTLRAGLAALPDQPIVDGRVFDGLADTLAVFVDVAPDSVRRRRAGCGRSWTPCANGAPARCPRCAMPLRRRRTARMRWPRR